MSVGTMVLGGVMQYKAAGQAQKYNTKVANVNAAYAEQQAVDAERLGSVQAHERVLQMRQQIGSQVAGFGAQNVAMEGTALEIIGDTAMIGKADADRIRANAMRTAHGFRMDAYNIRAGNKLDKFQTKVNQTGTILSTVGGVASALGNYSSSSPSKTTTVTRSMPGTGPN